MITLNLLPDIKREYLHARRLEARVISLSILAVIIAVGLTVLVALWVYAAQEVHKTLLTTSIKDNTKKLKSIKDIDKYVTIQSQLASIDSLHDSKGIYSRLFEDVLPKLNPVSPNSIKLSDLVVDATTTSLTLEGTTSTYTGLETFRDTLTNAKMSYLKSGQDATNDVKLFSKVDVLSQGLSTEGTDQHPVVSFKIMAIYDAATFARTSSSVTVTVPNIETTQSKQGAPDVFGGNQ